MKKSIPGIEMKDLELEQIPALTIRPEFKDCLLNANKNDNEMI